MTTILTIGELLWDILPDKTVLGGAPANFSYRINNLGFNSYLVTKIGNDNYGIKAIDILKKQNISTDYIQIDESHPTGTVNVFFDENKKPDYEIIQDVAYDYIDFTPELSSMAQNVDCIYFGSLVQRSEITRNTIAQTIKSNPECLKFYDINLRKKCYSKSIIEQSLNYSDIVKLNENEAFNLVDILGMRKNSLPEISNELISGYDLTCTIITLEERGSLICDANKNMVYSPGYRIKMEDSLGAGDAYSAGFLYKCMLGENIRVAAEFGNILGAIVATQKGATCEIGKEEIESFIKNNNHKIIDKKYDKYMSNPL